MAKWGNCDFRQLQNLQKKMEQMQKVDFQKFCEEMAKELAARLLAKVIKRTPVGQYPASTGKKGGTLRRGWTVGDITKTGDVYQIEVINPTHYASYVEFGHRTSNHQGWVEGRFMLTISENELDSQAPKLLEDRLKTYLEGMFDDK